MREVFSTVIFVTLVTVFQSCCAVEVASPTKITWSTNYEEAAAQAKSTQKPLLLLFTGPGWCSACELLEKEVINTKEFSDALGSQFIFVKLEFPKSDVAQDSRLAAQNNQLMNKYNVRGLPTVVLLDSQQQKIGAVTGYRSGQARTYTANLQKLVSDYGTYKQGVSHLGNQKTPGRQLKAMLEKARTLGLEGDELAIIQAGMDSDQKNFFQIERYRCIAEQGQIHEPEAVALKQQLLASDPNNAQKNHYYVAVIEFEAFSNEMEKENYSPELAVAPLVNYLERFGAQDKQNKWRLQMIISQVFLDKNKLALALRYAQSSYEAAPATVQPEIATAIRNLKSQSELQ